MSQNVTVVSLSHSEQLGNDDPLCPFLHSIKILTLISRCPNHLCFTLNDGRNLTFF